MIILLDMDGVIADFYQSCSDLFQVPLSQIDKTDNVEEALGLTPEEFWGRIDEIGELFWTEMGLYSWSQYLVNRCLEITPDTYICSNPGRNPSAYSGKVKWLMQHFPQIPRSNRIFCKDKHLLAGPDRYLIDDRETVGTRFQKAGGTFLLFPQPWNRSSWTVDQFLSQLGNFGVIETSQYKSKKFNDWDKFRDAGQIYQIFDREDDRTHLGIGNYLLSRTPKKGDTIRFRHGSKKVVATIDKIDSDSLVKTLYVNTGLCLKHT